jgi:hypothetical protein
MTIPPPYIVARTSRKAMDYVLVEPYDDGRGGIASRYHDLAGTRDPRVAMARSEERIRDRELWAGTNPSPEELAILQASRAKLAALAAAVAKMESA